MSNYDILTKHIPIIESNSENASINDKKSSGKFAHSIQIGYVNYLDFVDDFISDVYAFKESNGQMELDNYMKILEDNDLEWSKESMMKADVTNLNAQCVLALIIGVIRAERFNDGLLIDFFENKCILKWLKRLEFLSQQD